MAGYIFSLDSLQSLNLYTNNGVYATKLSPPRNNIWKTHHEGTFADYYSMQPGDNVYFFINRKIYGIGKLINVEGDCKYFNLPRGGEPRIFDYDDVRDLLLWDEGDNSVNQRCLCLFEPDPFFFKLGIDMDDVLSSNPSAIKMLRAFWKLSFIKFDDEENQAFRDIVLKRNQDYLSSADGNHRIFPNNPIHDQISTQLTVNNYRMESGISSILSSCADDDYLRHEMAIEAGLIHQLSIKDPHTCDLFGEWDYLSHQVIASPFKPIDYMDKMDLFGYSYIPGHLPTKSRILVGEIKKDPASEEDIDQLLKYIDWVKDEYCYGDYSMVDAFLITYEFPENVIQHKQNVGSRKYTIGVRPAQSLEWSNISLVKYSLNPEDGKISFTLID